MYLKNLSINLLMSSPTPDDLLTIEVQKILPELPRPNSPSWNFEAGKTNRGRGQNSMRIHLGSTVNPATNWDHRFFFKALSSCILYTFQSFLPCGLEEINFRASKHDFLCHRNLFHTFWHLLRKCFASQGRRISRCYKSLSQIHLGSRTR